ncbi:RNA polymerase sigma factor for flagellar operon FliA [Natranaerovirga pectinivora]|uniref:RNA polymerase sigma factor for flagellar operon FliA n=1 Tax=Natranaerovirga pectinivora TaxID=682400 RepID=A0A4R3MMK1_9FIRM|nr:FliA/WhiG family RNA polymerase sigma factor [Natranaerovirga pectinivora]TCT15075.1 RNA polymerase sigma factor for flagellar operon FliA [Natranaerovirga pectinivora]
MDDVNKNNLWELYKKTKSKEIKDQLIIEYAPLIKFVAGRLSMYLGNNVEYEDLVGYGVFGLIDAIDKFDYLKGVKFETYASLRIRGSIIDQIRKMDWIPRSLRQKQKKIDEAFYTLENKLGRQGTDEEMAEALELSVDQYHDWLGKTKMLNMVSLDEFIEQGYESNITSSKKDLHYDQPDKIIQKEELQKALKESIEGLTEKEKKVVVLYYFEELTLKEISYILEVSESRISQLHTKALQKMRLKLGEFSDIIML